MSNIMTSFIRIYRRDGQPIEDAEIDRLFEAGVRAYDRFGSYWVRVLKKYRVEERCLDIQFGSSKRYNNLLESEEFHWEYIIWERIADEGGFPDQLYQYQWDDKGRYVDMKSFGKAVYAFDKLILYAEELPEELKNLGFEQKESDSFQLNVAGTYHSSSDRSFTDLHEDSEFYGPSLGYDPNYASDYFVLQKNGEIQSISISELKGYISSPRKKLLEGMSIEFLYQFRTVARIEHDLLGIEEFTASFWDNCKNPEYFNFRKDFIENNIKKDG